MINYINWHLFNGMRYDEYEKLYHLDKTAQN